MWALFGASSILVAGTGNASLLELVGRLGAPVALVLLYRVEPSRALFAALAGFLLLVAVSRDIGLGLRTALPVGVSGLLLARGMTLSLKPSVSIAEASIPFLLIAFFLIAAPPAPEEREAEVDRVVQGSLALNREIGSDPESLKLAGEMTRWMVETAITVMPAALVLYFLGLTTIVYRLACGVLGRYGLAFRELAPFREWKTPFALVWLFAAGLAGVLVGGERAGGWAANLLFGLCSVYFVQGLAVLSWQFRSKGVSTVARTLFFVAAVVLVFPFFVIATTGAGLFDTWFDFRRAGKDAEREE